MAVLLATFRALAMACQVVTDTSSHSRHSAHSVQTHCGKRVQTENRHTVAAYPQNAKSLCAWYAAFDFECNSIGGLKWNQADGRRCFRLIGRLTPFHQLVLDHVRWASIRAAVSLRSYAAASAVSQISGSCIQCDCSFVCIALHDLLHPICSHFV